MQFIPYEPPHTPDGRYALVQSPSEKLHDRRTQLGLTQHDVAHLSGVQLKQYQRLELGERSLERCSTGIVLAVCAVLLLDPYELLQVEAVQADPADMKPAKTVEIFEVP